MSNQVYQNPAEKYYHQPGNNYYSPAVGTITILKRESAYIQLVEGLVKVPGVAEPALEGLRILKRGHYCLNAILRIDPVSGQFAVQPEIVIELTSATAGTGNVAKLKTNVEALQATDEPGNPVYTVLSVFGSFFADAGDFVAVKVTNWDNTTNSTIAVISGGSELVLNSAY